MGEVVQKVTTDLTFHNGVLVPVGVPIAIDTSKVSLEGPSKDNPFGNHPNLADIGDAAVNRPVAISALGPTGPAPTMPQQVPPGAFQTGDGYVVPGGATLVADGSAAALAAAAAAGEEEEAPVRRQPAERTGDATSAAGGPTPRDLVAGAGDQGGDGGLNDAERAELIELRRQRDEGAFVSQSGAPASGASTTGDAMAASPGATPGAFDPAAIVSGTVAEVTPRLDGLNREQLLAVRDAEQDRDEATRTTLTAAIDAKLAALDAAAGQA